MSRDFDVVIVGGGIVGSVMASLLAARGLCEPGRVAILSDRPMPGTASPSEADWDLRVFALSRASERLLKLCGIWQALPPQRLFAYQRMCVWDASGSPTGLGSISFDCADLGEPNLGFIVDGRVLQERSAESARACGTVIIEAAVRAIAVGEAGVAIELQDGRSVGCKLVVGADGADSMVRRLLGIETAGHAYHQDALVGHVRTVKPHAGTAWQRFLPTGPLAFLPLPDGRSSIVWSAARAEAARLTALDRPAFDAALDEASGGVLGGVELTTPLARYPLKLQYALSYVRERAALLGDAAHAVHPLAGQGLNLGLLDCATLAEVLGEAAGRDRFGEHRLLRRYERRRKSENLLAATAFDGLERLFASSNPVLARLRAEGLRRVGNVGFVKRQFARQAMGLAGDVPGFLKADRV
jgi:2-polyprenylphenol 6-hydroxylase